MTEKCIQVHFSLIGSDLVIRCERGKAIEEFIPSAVVNGDLPYGLIDEHHHWYMESEGSIEIRPDSRSWSKNGPRNWKITLKTTASSLTGTAKRKLMSGSSKLVDPHSRIYRHLSNILKPLEPRHDGILVSVDNKDPVFNPKIFLQRHNLTFSITPPNSLECQSFPGFVVALNDSGIGSLVGLQQILSLQGKDSENHRMKIIVPKGVLSSRIGLHGHPLTLIDVQNDGGYFAYDVDELLGRFCGSRSVESDLFLVQLHAFTASPLADPLTGRSGTSVALEYLGNSSCFSAHRLSKEARSYLDTLASLTPPRAFYPPHLQVMETIDWKPALPPLSQHPSFLYQVEQILEYWRTMEVFHSLGQLLKPTDLPTGMNHLSKRATARYWVYHVSAQMPQPLEDLIHHHRDSINDGQSQERERLAFHIAHLANPMTSRFPLCTSLKSTIESWESVERTDEWTWVNVEKWLPHATSMNMIWCTLYQLCKRAKCRPTFSLIAALSLLGYRGAPTDILATLMVVARQFEATKLNFHVTTRLDLTKGSSFNGYQLEKVLRGYSIRFEQSKEFNIEREKDETNQARYIRIKRKYDDELSRQVNQAISDLRCLWPDLRGRLNMTDSRLLNLDDGHKEILYGIVLEWSRNRTFLNHIDQVSEALDRFHHSTTIPDLYSPDPNSSQNQSLPIPILGIGTLLELIRPPSPIQITPKPPHGAISQSNNGATTSKLKEILDQLKSSADQKLEKDYLDYLDQSIAAFDDAQSSSHDCRKAPSSEQLRRFQYHTRITADYELSLLKDALIPRDYISTIKMAVGLLPAITPITLIRQLSLHNRKNIPEAWRNRLLNYAVTIQDAQWGIRMQRLLSTGREHHLLLEAQTRRKWNPYERPDWLLIEIDADLSIRPQQADMAKEMISPPKRRNSVMQLNMGEGKSSVSNNKNHYYKILMCPNR
jgi:hypothetical protein